MIDDLRRIQTELDASERAIQELRQAHAQEITRMRLDFMQSGQAMHDQAYARAQEDFDHKWGTRERDYQNQINRVSAELEQLKQRDAMQE